MEDLGINVCPFCEAKAGELYTTITATGMELDNYIVCKGCGCHGPKERNKHEAIESWNCATEGDTNGTLDEPEPPKDIPGQPPKDYI